jgi:hypothetical protein
LATISIVNGLPKGGDLMWDRERKGNRYCSLRSDTDSPCVISLDKRASRHLAVGISDKCLMQLSENGVIRLGDLSPTESWGDSSQNGFQNVRIVGDTELIWNRQQ